MLRIDEQIEKSWIARVGVTFLLVTLVFAFLYILRATELTGSAISYAAKIKSGHDLIHPQHLGYMPIIQAFHLVFSDLFKCDIICSGQIHGIIWAVITLVSLYLLLRRLIGSAFGAFLASLFTLVSHNFWIYSTQLEVYVPVLGCLTLLAAILYLRCTTSCRMSNMVILSGLWALSILYHEANVIFIIPLGYYMISTQGKQGWKQVGIISVLSGIVVLSGYVLAFLSTSPVKTVGEFINFTIALAKVPMTDWGSFVPWTKFVIKSVILSEFSVFLVLPEYFRNLLEPFSKIEILTIAFIIAFILLWNIVQCFRRVPEYKVRVFFLLWFVSYFLFFLKWDPRVHKFFIPTVIPLVVLGSVMLRDMLATSGISKLTRIIAIGAICCFITVTFMSNLYSSVLPVRSSFGVPYYEAETINILAPKNCMVYDFGHNVASLGYYFNRNYEKTDSVRRLYSNFYNSATAHGLRNDMPFQNEECTFIRLGYLSPHYFHDMTKGYLDSSEWSEFIKWVFGVEYQGEDNSVTYNPFIETSHEGGPSYIVINRSKRVTATTVDELFEKLEYYIDINKEKFGNMFPWTPTVLLKKARIDHSQQVIFGHGMGKP